MCGALFMYSIISLVTQTPLAWNFTSFHEGTVKRVRIILNYEILKVLE
jgi:hypothetical protein